MLRPFTVLYLSNWPNMRAHTQLVHSNSPSSDQKDHRLMCEPLHWDTSQRYYTSARFSVSETKTCWGSCHTNAGPLEDLWGGGLLQWLPPKNRIQEAFVSRSISSINMQRTARLPVRLSSHALRGNARLLSLIPIKSCDFAEENEVRFMLWLGCFAFLCAALATEGRIF